MIAALFVATNGVYFNLPDVDPYDEKRDARLYAGPHRIVAHPPCPRFGAMATGGPRHQTKRAGDDDGCFRAAIASVRQWGGVLEHPAGSLAWALYGLTPPGPNGGWTHADLQGGFTCEVEQGHYGHRARKRTWLYLNHPEYHAGRLPQLKWGSSARDVDTSHIPPERLRAFIHPPRGMSQELRSERRAFLHWYEAQSGRAWCTPELMNKKERNATPTAFRDVLLAIARGESPPDADAP